MKSGIGKTIVVVGYQVDKIKSILGEDFIYVYLSLLFKLSPSKSTGEYYLTDVVSLLNKQDLRVEVLRSEDPTVALGLNTHEDSKRANKIIKQRALER